MPPEPWLPGKISVELLASYPGHEHPVYALASKNNDIFFSGDASGLIVQWHRNFLVNPFAVCRAPSPVYCLQYVIKYNILIAGLKDGGVLFIDSEENKIIKKVAVHSGPVFDIKEIENEIVLMVSGDGALSFWSLPEIVCELKAEIGTYPLRSVAVSDDNRWVACGGAEGFLNVYEISGLKKVAELKGHLSTVFSLCFSPYTNTLWSGGRDAYLRIWDCSSGFIPVNEIPAHLFTLNDLALANGNALIASASRDKSIRIWSAQSSDLLKVIAVPKVPAHTASVNKILWSANGLSLISCGDDRKILEWVLKPIA
jgi:WD40 repeat protein